MLTIIMEIILENNIISLWSVLRCDDSNEYLLRLQVLKWPWHGQTLINVLFTMLKHASFKEVKTLIDEIYS